MLFPLLVVLTGGTALYGVNFLFTSWQLVRDGVSTVAEEVMANRYFKMFLGAIGVAIILPFSATFIALYCSPGMARWMIGIGFVISISIFITFLFLARLVANVIRFLAFFDLTESSLEKGVWIASFAFIAWESVAAVILLAVGPYSTALALLVAFFGVVICFCTYRAYKGRFGLVQYGMASLGVVAIAWAIAASISSPWWIWATGEDLRPAVNMESPLDSEVVHENNRIALEKETELCTEELLWLRRLLVNAPSLKIARKMEERIREKEKECARRTALWK